MDSKYKKNGFTLIEVMIVVAIVGILSAIAYPSYQRYIQDTREREAQANLLEWAGHLEIYRAKNFTYQGATRANTFPALAAEVHYDYTLLIWVNNQGFTLTATPQGMMVGRPDLTLDSTGETSW